jgi:AAA domain/Domain of unknown function (DUF3854)
VSNIRKNGKSRSQKGKTGPSPSIPNGRLRRAHGNSSRAGRPSRVSSEWDALPLSPRHIKVLTSRAISPAIAEKRGYRTIDDPEHLANFRFAPGQRHKGILIPVRVVGSDHIFQLRPTFPPSGRDGKELKYIWPINVPSRLDLGTWDLLDLEDADEVWVVESPLKADALASVGIMAVSIFGCWGWRGPRVLGDLLTIEPRGKTFYLVPDSDFFTHPDRTVEKANRSFADWLTDQGANPRLVPVPPGPSGDKVGPDDFLANGHAVSDLYSLATRAAEYFNREQLHTLRHQEKARALYRSEVAAASWEEPAFVPSLKEELDLPHEPVEYSVDQLQVKGTNVGLIAQYKVGKTTFGLDLVASLVDEKVFLGQFRPRKLDGRVAYWNYELNRNQFREWCRRLGIAHPEQVVLLNLREHRMPLLSPHVEQWTIEWLRDHEVEYWILDPWRRAIVGSAKENDNDEITRLTETIDVIKRRAGVLDTLVTVHTPRAPMTEGDERARGGSGFDDWVDARWVLTKNKEGQRFFRASGRDVQVEELTIGTPSGSARLDTIGGSRQSTSVENNILAVCRVVRENPGANYRGIESVLPINQNEKGPAIHAARSRKLIENRGTEHRHSYFLTHSGEIAISQP